MFPVIFFGTSWAFIVNFGVPASTVYGPNLWYVIPSIVVKVPLAWLIFPAISAIDFKYK